MNKRSLAVAAGRPPRLAMAAIAGITLIAALLAQEFAVRLSLPAYDPSGHLRFTFDQETGVPSGEPNSVHRQILNAGDYDVTVRFNQYGFRDSRDLATGTEEDVYVVGDSFAFGWGVEAPERFSNQLEKLIGRPVFNIGLPADIDGYARLLDSARRRGAAIRRVIIAVNMIDDLADYSKVSERPIGAAAKTNGSAERASIATNLIRIKSLLTANSALYFLSTSLVHRVDWLKRALIGVGLIVPLQTVRGGEPTERDIISSADRLAKIAGQFKVTILVIPSRAIWLGKRRAASRRNHETFINALSRRGLNVVDMLGALERGGVPMRYHFRNDGHWRPEGHRLAAEALAAALASARD